MSHQLFGERFLTRNEPAWHKLGRTFTGEVTATDAISEIAADVIVEKVPLVIPASDGREAIPTKHSAIIRRPTADDPETDVFGITGSRYDIVQYADLGAPLDVLTETYALETAGILYNGRRMFVAFRADAFDVKGDEREKVDNYVVIVMSQEPGISHRLMHTMVRVVCHNTLTYATKESALSITIPHTAHAAQTLALGAEVIASLSDKVETQRVIFDAMATVACDVDALDAILNAAYPNPKPRKSIQFLAEAGLDIASCSDRFDPATYKRLTAAHDSWLYNSRRAIDRRDAAREAYERINDECPTIAGTVYAAYQAVTETSDWREGRGDIGRSVLFGSRASEKASAYAAAVRLAGVSSN